MNFKFGLLGALALWVQVVQAQTNAFTYQGQLASGGAVVTGNYDLRFRLFDIDTNLVAGPVTNAPVGVTNGLFLTTVDFGATNFPGAARFLEIAVRTYGSTSAYTILAPNQPLTSTPYAIQSLNAANAEQLSQPLPATNISGTVPISVLSTNVALLTSNQIFSAANTFTGVVTANNPANVFGGTLNGAFNGTATGTFSGTGSNLTAIPATSLTGTLPDANLSTNVPLVYKNANFLTNVTAVLFTGSGHGLTNVPGAFFWLTVNGTTAQASSNLGFIVTNNTTPVTITLPASPSVGDTFKVAGVGAGGWILAQNAGQQVLAGNLAASTGLSWTSQTNSGKENWTGLSSSADGTKLVGVTQGYIYYSVNSGVTWSQSAPVYTGTYNGGYYWSAVAASADGSHLVATVGESPSQPGYIYTSSSFGESWSQAETFTNVWTACASSASGNNLVAVSYNGTIYLSANAGGSWTALTGGPSWTGVASSADGTKLVATSTGGQGGYIYTSSNSGASWVTQTNSGLRTWSAVASSADGNLLVATVAGTGGIYASQNAGVTWFQVNPNVSVNWTAVASSSDGSHLAAAYDSGTYSTPGYIYTSTDSGSSWTQRYGATNAAWTAITSSADGSKLAAAAYGGYIYTSAQGSTTTSGTTGYLIGGYLSALELQYVGNGIFLPLNHEGNIRAY